MEQPMSTTEWNMVSEVELIYKSRVKASERPQIKRSRDAYELLLTHWDLNRIELVEQFKVILMNRNHRVLGIYEVSTGGVTGTVADPKLIFMAALKINACNLVISHNHPSGGLQPSEADKTLTEKIKGSGKLLDIPLLDHIIITPEAYFSFADEGLL